jgi:hypothetical protein
MTGEEDDVPGDGRVTRPEPLSVTSILQQVVVALAALATSEKWLSARHVLLSQLDDLRVDELVCYCLGSLTSGQVMDQAALLLLLANELRVPPERRFVFDPVHTDVDKEALSLLGFTCLNKDEDCERQISHGRTLFYMPFAPYQLTDNLVRANWNGLHRLAIVGNPLEWVVDPCFDLVEDADAGTDSAAAFECTAEEEAVAAKNGGRRRRLLGRAPCIEQIVDLCEERVLWDGDHSTWLSGDKKRKLRDTGQTAANADADEDEDEDDTSQHALNSTLVTFPARPGPLKPPAPPRYRPDDPTNRSWSFSARAKL